MEQQQVQPEKLIMIIGLKEVELTILREQIQQLLQENAELKNKDKSQI